jgi:hypothetical protein
MSYRNSLPYLYKPRRRSRYDYYDRDPRDRYLEYLINSQRSVVNQNISNSGWMSNVNQTAVVNQYNGYRYGGYK